MGWGENDRGVSFTFGEDVVAQFLRRHDLDLICRAHQVVEDGYEFFARRQLVTIFSAPNYCGEFDNAGAMMSVDDTLMCSFQILKPAEKKQRLTQAGEGKTVIYLLSVNFSFHSRIRRRTGCCETEHSSCETGSWKKINLVISDPTFCRGSIFLLSSQDFCERVFSQKNSLGKILVA